MVKGDPGPEAETQFLARDLVTDATEGERADAVPALRQFVMPVSDPAAVFVPRMVINQAGTAEHVFLEQAYLVTQF